MPRRASLRRRPQPPPPLIQHPLLRDGTPKRLKISPRPPASRDDAGMDREQWNSRYAGSELLWSAHPNRFLAAEVAELAPGRALDLACGEGRNAVWLGERGWEVTGVDFSDVALAKAAKLADERGVRIEWIQADLLQFVPEPGSFDLIVVLYLHLVAADRRKVLAGVAAAVAGGGVLLVVGHDSSNLLDGYGGPKDPAILFTPDEVAGELSGLRIERAERVRRPVDSPQGETDAIDALVRAERSDLERRRRSGADRFDRCGRVSTTWFLVPVAHMPGSMPSCSRYSTGQRRTPASTS